MSAALAYALTGAAIAALSTYRLLVATDLLRRILAINLLGTGIFVMLIAIGFREGGATPDPVPHALVLTGIVVAVSATGLALSLARQLLAGGAKSEDV